MKPQNVQAVKYELAFNPGDLIYWPLLCSRNRGLCFFVVADTRDATYEDTILITRARIMAGQAPVPDYKSYDLFDLDIEGCGLPIRVPSLMRALYLPDYQ